MNLGWPELVIILVILLLLFGSTKLPKLTRSLGESAKNLKDGFEGKGSSDDEGKKSKKA